MKNTSSKLTRRGMIEKAGIATAALPVASEAVLGRNENLVELPKFISGGEPTAYFTVPKKWDEHRKQAKFVQQKIDNRFRQNERVTGFGLSKSQATYGGKNGLQVTVLFDEEAGGPPAELPDKVDGIPVASNAEKEGKQGGCSISDGTEDCVNHETDTTVNPGEYIQGPAGGGTAGMKMINNNGDSFILTVAHLFETGCPNNVDGKTAESGNANEVGSVEYSNGVDDWAVVDLNSDAGTSHTIDDNAGFPTCSDVVSESYLQNWESQDKSNRPCLYQMGCTTGKTTGRLKYANYTHSSTIVGDCVTYNDDGTAEGVFTYCGFGQGDSGGPTWHMENGNAHLVSTTALYHGFTGQTCNNDFGPDSSGMGAYEIEDTLYGFTV